MEHSYPFCCWSFVDLRQKGEKQFQQNEVVISPKQAMLCDDFFFLKIMLPTTAYDKFLFGAGRVSPILNRSVVFGSLEWLIV